jgi:hypothetical protein
MRIATTAVLGAAALALGAAIHRVDHAPVSGRRAAELANVLVRFEPESVDRITVERGAERTVLTKRQGAWYFSEPEEDRVDATLALALLDRINHFGIVEDLGEGGIVPEPTSLGLEGDRAIRVTLSGEGGKGTGAVSETIVLGLEAPRSGSIYAKREGGDPGAFVVDGNVRPWLEDPLAALRDRKLLAAPVGAVVHLVIRQASGEIALQRRLNPPKQDWALAAPLVSWADREAMDELLTALGGLRIEEVVKDAPGSGEIPDPLPAETAVLQVQVQGIEQPLTIFLRKVGTADDGRPVLEARASDRPAVYRCKSDFLAALPKSPNDLRDRTLARIPLEYLDSIKIQSRIDPLVDLRAERSGPNVSWKVALSNKLVPANANEVNALITAVNEAAIQRFVSDEATDLAGYGLVPPQRRIVFDLKLPGTPLADGTPGAPRPLLRVLNLGWNEGEEQRLYANFEGEPHVHELDPTFLNLIATHPVKWKSLNVITFNPVHLVSITREIPEKDNLKLDYDYRRDQWSASRSGVDVTNSLDIASARRLRDRLGSLTASGWYLSLAPAYEALQNPSVTFTLVTKELDRATNEPVEQTRVVRFAPFSANLYFGRIDDSPDVFFLDHETYRDLIRPVTTARVPVP